MTLPLVWKDILVGSLFSFMTSIQEASATLFLTLGGWEMIPGGIFTFYIAGSQNEAAASGFILTWWLPSASWLSTGWPGRAWGE